MVPKKKGPTPQASRKVQKGRKKKKALGTLGGAKGEKRSRKGNAHAKPKTVKKDHKTDQKSSQRSYGSGAGGKPGSDHHEKGAGRTGKKEKNIKLGLK